LRGELALEAAMRAEALGAREIDDEHHRELALLDVALHVRAAHARRHVPIDAAYLVTGPILAHLGELHPLPFEHGAILAGEERVHEPARPELDQFPLAQDLGRRVARRCALVRPPRTRRRASRHGTRRAPAASGHTFPIPTRVGRLFRPATEEEKGHSLLPSPP